MPLFDEYEVRSRVPSGSLGQLSRVLPRLSLPQEAPLPAGTVRLAAPDQSISPELEEAFLQGTLGGAVGGGAARGAEAGDAQRLADIEYWDKEPAFRSPPVTRERVLNWERRVNQALEDMVANPSDPWYRGELVREIAGRPVLEAERLMMDKPVIDSAKEALQIMRRPDWDTERVAKILDRHSNYPEGFWNDRSMQEYARREYLEPFDKRVPPSRMSRAGSVLKAGARGLFNPVKIAADMLAGGAVGAGSAGLGYAVGGGDRESAGLFTPPGEGYEGLVRAEDIERVVAQKELDKEAERQRLLEQYRASGYDLDPNTRLRDLR